MFLWSWTYADCPVLILELLHGSVMPLIPRRVIAWELAVAKF